jgi:uncharacterized protein YgiM (DUF1202 family)
MKKHYALALGMFLAASLVAQTNSSSPVPPAAPTPATPAPAPAVVQTTAPAASAPAPAKTAKPTAKAASKKTAPKKPAVVEKPVALQAGPATVDASNVNVRGRSTILSEVLSKLNKGDTVTVLEQVENKWAKGDDMKQWARIAYPTNASVWVFASFVDSNKTVTAPKLNVRGGPGENYSIVGRLAKGATVTEIGTKGEWMRIAPPEGVSAYVAAVFLKQDAAQVAAAEPVKPAPPTVPVSTSQITDVDPAMPPTVDAASTNAASGSTDLAAFIAGISGSTNPIVNTPVEEPPQPRVVMREGILHNATSIQAPSHYSLVGLETGRTINYLYTTSTHVNLNRYNGKHIIVTGEESLDQRWPNTPVLTLQRIQVVDEK